MFINKKSHKSAFVCIAVFMVTMIMILTFYQLAVEIYAYGFITKNNDYRVKESTAKVLTLKENHKDINKKNINVNGKIKSINNKAINADQEMLTTSIVNKNELPHQVLGIQFQELQVIMDTIGLLIQAQR